MKINYSKIGGFFVGALAVFFFIAINFPPVVDFFYSIKKVANSNEEQKENVEKRLSEIDAVFIGSDSCFYIGQLNYLSDETKDMYFNRVYNNCRLQGDSLSVRTKDSHFMIDNKQFKLQHLLDGIFIIAKRNDGIILIEKNSKEMYIVNMGDLSNTIMTLQNEGYTQQQIQDTILSRRENIIRKHVNK